MTVQLVFTQIHNWPTKKRMTSFNDVIILFSYWSGVHQTFTKLSLDSQSTVSHLDSTAVVTCTIYHLESSDDSDSVSSESEASTDNEEREEEEMEGGVRMLGWQPKGAKRPLGEWEKHTTVR